MSVVLTPTVEKHNRKITIGTDYSPLVIDNWLLVTGQLKDKPDHTQLPETDGSIVANFQEHPQSSLLTDAITPVLKKIHPDGQYAIGQNSLIYWEWTDPLLDGAKAPDWFYVPNVAPLLDDEFRRSYVLWKEHVPPLIAVEMVSGDGKKERDMTPLKGKLWVYENGIRIKYYAIIDAWRNILEVYKLVKGSYQLLKANKQGRYWIEELGVEIGMWAGTYQNMTTDWLRFWDGDGNLLLTGDERAKRNAQRAEWERVRAEWNAQRAEQEAQRAEREAKRAEQEAQRAEQADERAEQEAQRAEQAEKALQETAINMLAIGMDMETIANLTKLPIKQINQLSEELS
ncbi:MAG: hypothetical protein B6242_06760 [Anaerolineaceae bacterium 4572_78]|nr:MAG: hypothetical protein B6242_06760 [Anaerolineaceae bacterium 4572_78]